MTRPEGEWAFLTEAGTGVANASAGAYPLVVFTAFLQEEIVTRLAGTHQT